MRATKGKQVIQNVIVEFTCPACGSEGYEFELDADDLRASEISIPCEDCGKRIALMISAEITVRKDEDEDAESH